MRIICVPTKKLLNNTVPEIVPDGAKLKKRGKCVRDVICHHTRIIPLSFCSYKCVFADQEVGTILSKYVQQILEVS
jgi:hypothetical protein